MSGIDCDTVSVSIQRNLLEIPDAHVLDTNKTWNATAQELDVRETEKLLLFGHEHDHKGDRKGDQDKSIGGFGCCGYGWLCVLPTG